MEDTIFVYSGDKLVAEYSTTPKTNPKIQYVATDTLGSVRAITDQYGEIVSRRDFMPFGEELQADANYRKANLKYNSDDVRQKFTGYQKDEETGLDFAEARMYNNSHARFTAVDPLLASGKSANPQTFNRYVYVINSPMQYTDPTGLQVGGNNNSCDLATEQCAGTVSKGQGTAKRLNFFEPIATVNVEGEEPTFIETSSSNISGNITPQPTFSIPNVPSLPYTSSAGLVYDRLAMEEIELHLNGRRDKSQYEFSFQVEFLGNEFDYLIDLNDSTYLNGISHPQPNGRTSYINTLPSFEYPPYAGIMLIVGFDELEQDYTNVNTLIVDTNRVVRTSHPGFPRHYPGRRPKDAELLEDFTRRYYSFDIPIFNF